MKGDYMSDCKHIKWKTYIEENYKEELEGYSEDYKSKDLTEDDIDNIRDSLLWMIVDDVVDDFGSKVNDEHPYAVDLDDEYDQEYLENIVMEMILECEQEKV